MVEGAAIEAEGVDFATFFHDEYEVLLRAVYLLTGDRYEAEELAQDTFVKACERWDRVRTMDNPVGYLYRMAVNAHRSRLRRVGLATRRALSLRQSDPISESDDRDQIRRALASLPVTSGKRSYWWSGWVCPTWKPERCSASLRERFAFGSLGPGQR